jgi:gluconate 2-dehydrogenase subunit 3-like protein
MPTGQEAFPNERPPSGAGTALCSGDLETLAEAMDEIIPAGDGMPPASMAGGPQYLQYLGWQYPAIQEEIAVFLKMLTQASDVAFQEDFQTLRPDQGVQILAAMEKTQVTVFSTFVGYVYESYYTNPKVLGLISCSPSSPAIEDDEALLAPVRRLTHLYREVP